MNPENIVLDTKSQYCTILFIWNVQNWEIPKDKKWEWSVMTWCFFQREIKCSKIDCSDGCTTLTTLATNKLYTLSDLYNMHYCINLKIIRNSILYFKKKKNPTHIEYKGHWKEANILPAAKSTKKRGRNKLGVVKSCWSSTIWGGLFTRAPSSGEAQYYHRQRRGQIKGTRL